MSEVVPYVAETTAEVVNKPGEAYVVRARSGLTVIFRIAFSGEIREVNSITIVRSDADNELFDIVMFGKRKKVTFQHSLLLTEPVFASSKPEDLRFVNYRAIELPMVITKKEGAGRTDKALQMRFQIAFTDADGDMNVKDTLAVTVQVRSRSEKYSGSMVPLAPPDQLMQEYATRRMILPDTSSEPGKTIVYGRQYGTRPAISDILDFASGSVIMDEGSAKKSLLLPPVPPVPAVPRTEKRRKRVSDLSFGHEGQEEGLLSPLGQASLESLFYDSNANPISTGDLSPQSPYLLSPLSSRTGGGGFQAATLEDLFGTGQASSSTSSSSTSNSNSSSIISKLQNSDAFLFFENPEDFL